MNQPSNWFQNQLQYKRRLQTPRSIVSSAARFALAVASLAGPCTAAAQSTRTAAEVSILSSVDGGPWAARRSVMPLAGQSVRLRAEAAAGARVRWYQLIPDVDTMHKNANHPWEPDAYKWVGLAKVRYEKEELTKFRDRSEIELFRRGAPARLGDWTDAYRSRFVTSPYYRPDLGSFWFQVEVEEGGGVRRSPGLEESDARGLSPAVLRLSVREGPGLLGFITSFFNVPAVFGSIPHQSNNYLAADCADVLVSARAKLRGRDELRNMNVDMLVSSLPKRTEFDLDGGRPSRNLRWGTDIRPADYLAVRYPGARRYQHIGAMYRDDGDGVLGPGDFVIHAGPMPLALSRLGDGAFDGHIAVLRPETVVRERPISFSDARKEATRAYIRLHYGLERPDLSIEPEVVVLHWTGAGSLEASWRTFDRETLAQDRSDIAGGGALNVSAHFLVDRDGTIYRLLPETTMARHVIGLNLRAVGIENVGGERGREDLTEAQAAANAWLVRDLKDRFPGLRFLIGHDEYERFEGSSLWKELQPGYRTRKSDPGPRFMSQVRAQVEDLGLLAEP